MISGLEQFEMIMEKFMMKRIVANLLCLCSLFALSSCSQNGLSSNQTVTDPSNSIQTNNGNETQEPEFVSNVASPLTLEDLNSMPIAASSMSEDELRQLCVDFMNLQLTFPWQPNKTVSFTSGGSKEFINAGTVYGGQSYVSSKYSNIYKVMHYYDEKTGMLDTEKMGMFFGDIVGNQCSSNSFWAWARVVNSIDWNGTSDMTLLHGCLRVGPYTYDNNLDRYDHTVHTAAICSKNGRDTMFASYAAIKKADGIVQHNGSAGHVQMATENAIVVTNPDGSINGDESYVIFQDQQPSRVTKMQENGTPISVQAGLGRKITFSKLFTAGYLPFTFAEFVGTKPVEDGYAKLSHAGDTITAKEITDAVITSNYAISDITVTFKDKEGNIKGSTFYCHGNSGKLCCKELAISNMGCTAAGLSKHAQDDNLTVEIRVRIGNGEVHTIYTGAFVK